MVKRIEDFLTTIERRELANKIIMLTHQYKASFEQLSSITDANKNIPGCMAQIQNAQRILQNQQFDNFATLPEAFVAAQDWLNLMDVQSELCNTGVPIILVLELSRRVNDAHLPGSKELVLK